MTALLRINWSYCLGCTEGDHGTHVAEYFDDDVPAPCACACGGGQAPMRTAPCRYCGLIDCTDRQRHADWDRTHEVTIWRKAMAVLTPDDPALPGGTP